MPTTTTTYSFNKPVVGADEDAWGGYLNGNWDSVDDLLDGTTPVTGIDINSGTLDGVTIGGTTAGAGTFTTLTATTSITGTLATAAQANITSVGTLTSLGVSGDLTVDTNTLYVDSANNRVGVGTTSPTAPLEVIGGQLRVAASTASSMFLASPSTTYSDGIELHSTYNGGGSFGPMKFYTSGAERMRITSTGDLLVGTSSDYAENVQAAFYGASNGGIALASGTSGLSRLMFADGVAGTAGAYVGSIIYSHADDSMRFNVNGGSERMRIDASGRLLLGTTSSFADGNSDDLQISGAADTGMIIKSGTSSYGSIYFGDGTTGDARNEGIVRYQHSTNNMQFWTSATERMRIDSSGNLLVGTTSTGAASGGSGTSGININADGAVEIGRSVNPALFLNRTTSDGDIMQFRKNGTTVGSIGNASTNLIVEATSSNRSGLSFGGSITPRRGGANSDNAVDLGIGSIRFKDLYLSGGVYLGGTGAANKLTDVEYGTAIVSLWGTTNPATQVTATLYYTKVNDQVTFQVGFESVDTTGYAGDMRITGLPIANTSGSRCPVNIILYNAGTWSDTLVGIISGGSTTIDVMNARSGNTWSTVTHSAGTSRYIWASGSYKN